MTRGEAVAAVAYLARVDAQDAIERGDTNEAVRLLDVSERAASASGPDAWDSMWAWLTGCPRPDTSWADIGV